MTEGRDKATVRLIQLDHLLDECCKDKPRDENEAEV